MTFDSDTGSGRDDTHLGLTGHTVVDAALTKVGTVTDVLFDDDRAEAPRWAVVKTGLLGGEHLVPLDDSYVDQDGRLVVSPMKRDIKRAPKVGRDHVLTLRTRYELHEHYGIAA
jgi:hypothetical protein